MQTPTLTQNSRDGKWYITYYENGKHKRKSLGTRDRIAACIKYTKLTGIIMPTILNGSVPGQLIMNRTKPQQFRIATSQFVKAVNQFIKFKYGITDAWTRKSVPSSNNPYHMMMYLLKRLRISANITRINEATYNVIQGIIASLRVCRTQNGKRRAE